MPRVAYVNGRYERFANASVHIEDRGYQFADGVYEVCIVVDGEMWDKAGHLARLWRSLDALAIAPPLGEAALCVVMDEVLRRNRLGNALVYIQATRGVAPRNHPFPDETPSTSIVVTARPFSLAKSDRMAERGVSVITQPDIRWGRVDIKSISLLPNVLAKQAAKLEGAAEAWLVRDGAVSEGASSNAWIVTGAGELVTHPLGERILGGITRAAVIACAEELQMKVTERPFTIGEAMAAAECFLTSATNIVMPVTAIDGRKIAAGTPGPVASRLRKAYIDRSRPS